MARKKAVTAPMNPDTHLLVENGTRLVMEGAQKVCLCTSERMILQGKQYLEIRGEGLHLKELGNDNLEVIGNLSAVLFREEA